ncbi:MAG TPA: 16S rRNA (adenine(1518)-N(6)/adenine(1519)-N(6))-dimethyltransferase RsmA [Dongiaceae bacterium]|nr:16S rRNA (adenine(1518)-N(6)/adenine(1519)-N(6))-dimethyltransferase RsmA [Dongiaceae bacterium]
MPPGAKGFGLNGPFRPRRAWGQNFLVDARAVGIIARAFDPRPDDRVLEVGPGQGALTRAVAASVGRLLLVEVDPALAERLRADLLPAFPGTRIEILEADILAVPPRDLLARLDASPEAPARLLANLPYNIATAVILTLLPLHPALADLMVMVQREVAERITAPPGGKEYGSLSVLCQTYARVSPVLRLPPGAFRPRPKVTSEVIHLVLRDPGGAAAADRDGFARFVRAAFAARRKTLHNNLAGVVAPSPDAPGGRTGGGGAAGLGPEGARRLTAAAGIDGTLRPEQVPVDGFMALYEALRKAATRTL